MKNAISIASVALVALSVAGCGPQASQMRDPVRPLSYRASNDPLPRNVGRLRRLVVLPVRIHVLDGNGNPDVTQASLRDQIARAIMPFLRDQRGYEISEAHDRVAAKTVSNWFESSRRLKVGSEAPQNVAAAVRVLCSDTNSDGIIVIYGSIKPPSWVSFALTIGTAALAWPVLLVDSHYWLRADIAEAARGKIVWSSHYEDINISGEPPTRLPSQVLDMLDPLEFALPKILAEE